MIVRRPIETEGERNNKRCFLAFHFGVIGEKFRSRSLGLNLQVALILLCGHTYLCISYRLSSADPDFAFLSNHGAKE